VGGGIVIVQEPILTLPLFWTFLRNLFKTFTVVVEEKTSCAHYIPSTSKIKISIVLTLERTCRALFGLGEFGDFHRHSSSQRPLFFLFTFN
jgi:hypothetical protein